MPLHFGMGRLVTGPCGYPWVTEGCGEGLGGQLVMADVFIQVRIGIFNFIQLYGQTHIGKRCFSGS